MSFSKTDFVDFILANGVVGFFPEGRKLKSGRISHWYANCRALGDTAGSLARLAGFVLEFVHDLKLDYDYMYGVPEGGTKMGIICNYTRGHSNDKPDQPVVMGRGKPKEHGDPRDRYVIGPMQKGDKIIVLEDVTTTGGSMLKAVDDLLETGVAIQAVVALVNRLEKRDDGSTVADAVKQRGIAYHAMVTAADVLPVYIEREKPSAELIGNIEADFKEYGAQELKLQ